MNTNADDRDMYGNGELHGAGARIHWHALMQQLHQLTWHAAQMMWVMTEMTWIVSAPAESPWLAPGYWHLPADVNDEPRASSWRHQDAQWRAYAAASTSKRGSADRSQLGQGRKTPRMRHEDEPLGVDSKPESQADGDNRDHGVELELEASSDIDEEILEWTQASAADHAMQAAIWRTPLPRHQAQRGVSPPPQQVSIQNKYAALYDEEGEAAEPADNGNGIFEIAVRALASPPPKTSWQSRRGEANTKKKPAGGGCGEPFTGISRHACCSGTAENPEEKPGGGGRGEPIPGILSQACGEGPHAEEPNAGTDEGAQKGDPPAPEHASAKAASGGETDAEEGTWEDFVCSLLDLLRSLAAAEPCGVDIRGFLSIPRLDPQEVGMALACLIERGEIYTTVDDFHFLPTDEGAVDEAADKPLSLVGLTTQTAQGSTRADLHVL